MFFIEKGNVRLMNKENKLIKVLNSGESFGEIALIRGRKRLNSAIGKLIRGKAKPIENGSDYHRWHR